MRYVNPQNCYCETSEHNIVPLDSTNQLGIRSTILRGFISSFSSQNKGHATVGSWRVTRGDNNPVRKSGSLEVTGMSALSAISAGSCCCPSTDLSVSSDDSKTVSSFKILDNEPADLRDLKWVIDFDSCVCEDNLGVDHKDPEKYVYRDAVEGARNRNFNLSSVKECSDNQDFDCKYESEVNPATGWAESGFFGHVSKNTRMNLDYTGSTGHQKGKI